MASRTPSSQRIRQHADLLMFGLCIVCFLIAERLDNTRWLGLGFAALGLAGLIRGSMIVAQRYDEEIDGESGSSSTRTGWSAVFYGLHFVIAGCLAFALGVSVALPWHGLGPWAREHWAQLVGMGGLWLALIGATCMLGTVEARPASLRDHFLQMPGRVLSGLVMVSGMAVAFCGFAQVNPLRLL